MKQVKWNEYSPYFALPLICIAFWMIRGRWMNPFPLLLAELLLTFGYVASVVDFMKKKVPNSLVGMMMGAWILVIIPQLFFHTEQTITLLMSGIAGALLGGSLFLIVYVISRKGLGGGDVKLITASGLYLGLDGILPAILYGSVLSAIAAGIMILRKKINRKDTIPLVPFLYIGMLLTMLVG